MVSIEKTSSVPVNFQSNHIPKSKCPSLLRITLLALAALALFTPAAAATKALDGRVSQEVKPDGGFVMDPDNFGSIIRDEPAAEEHAPPRGLFTLGRIHLEGLYGVKKDADTGVRLINQAAAMNLPEAEFALGVMFLEGKGVAKDLDKAIEWFEKAYKNGVDDSLFRLAEVYLTKYSETKDHDEELQFLLKVAENLSKAQEKGMNQANQRPTKERLGSTYLAIGNLYLDKRTEVLQRAFGEVGAVIDDDIWGTEAHLKSLKYGEEALEYFQKGADLGNADAAHNYKMTMLQV